MPDRLSSKIERHCKQRTPHDDPQEVTDELFNRPHRGGSSFSGRCCDSHHFLPVSIGTANLPMWLVQGGVPVSSSYRVTPRAQMSTFSEQAAISEVFTTPLITASTGGSATTCMFRHMRIAGLSQSCYIAMSMAHRNLYRCR